MFKIEFLGIDHVYPSDFVYEIDKHDWWLLLHIKTPALFHLHGEDVIVPADSVVLYPPNTAADYEACAETLCNSYIRFYTDDPIITQTRIPLAVPLPIKDPAAFERIFELISRENYNQFKKSDQSIDLLINILMNKLEESAEYGVEPNHTQALCTLRYEIKMNPAFPWTVKEMADKIQVSAGYLQNLYKKQFGVACMQDVVDARISLAKEHLSTTNASSARIAQLCGYQNVEHFCRQFKAETGISPMKYRRLVQEEQSLVK